MKPVKLIIEGINSFTDAQTLDFEAVGRNNLFCISGKTGAGKTTIFDSIMFALYGRSGKGNLADVVNLSRMSARVVFDFTVGGDMYSVERTIKCRAEKDADGNPTDRRTANGDCMLYKNGVPHAKGEEATACLENIIGLEADEFKNVYLLEQGEYAKFLKKTPAKQTEAVGKIFSLMRFGDVHKLAGIKKREQDEKAEGVSARIRDLGDISVAKLNDEKKAIAGLRAKTTALKKECEIKRVALDGLSKEHDLYISVCEKQNAVKKLTLQSDEAKKNQYSAQTELAEFEKNIDPQAEKTLAGLRAQLNELSALNSLDNEYSATVADINKKKAELDGTVAKAAELDETRRELNAQKAGADGEYSATLGEFIECAARIADKSDALAAATNAVGGGNIGGAELTDIIYSLETDKRNYDACVETCKKYAAEYERTVKACDDALKVIERYENEYKTACEAKRDASENEERAQKALAAAQLNSHAAAIRAELHEGDKCPVCGGTYAQCAAVGDGDVEKRRAERDAAVKALKAATDREAECAKHLDREKSAYSHATAERDKTKALLLAANTAAAQTKVEPQVYARLFEILSKAKTVAAKIATITKNIADGEPVAAALDAERKAAERAIVEAERKAEEYRAKLGENCGKTEAQKTEVATRIAELEKAAELAEATRKSLKSRADSATATVEAVAQSLEAAKKDCPVDIPPFDEDGYNEKKEEIERLNARIVENEKDIAVKDVEIKVLTENCERLVNLEAERNGYVKSADNYDRIYNLTKNKAMLEYVAAEYIAEFTAIASEILNDVSGGKYTMTYDREDGFIVSDYLNGGKSRKTDTLSGGELFLASLAVAIAIARTQSRGHNAFFFLDEGFGTLDEELIDVVYGALESLSGDCLVGVITHAEALISRMPSCVEVISATDSTGSIIKY